MSYWRSAIVVCVGFFPFGLGVPGPAGGGDSVRHSGVVVEVDREKGAIVVEEIGLGRAGGAGNDITRRSIVTTPATAVVTLGRDRQAPTGFEGDWVERAAGLAEIKTGDFVTVESREDGQRLTASKITVPRLDQQ